MRFHTILSALACVAALSAACTPAARLSAPDGFTHLDGKYDDRVASARGVVVGARVEKNEPQANLEFWTDAIDLRLRQRGYVPEASSGADVKSASGLPGKSLRYTWFDGTRDNAYWVDVFATDRHVVLVEAAGATSDFRASEKAVEASMRSVRVD